MPSVFPFSGADDEEYKIIQDYFFQSPDKLVLHKLSHIMSQNSIQEILSRFMESESKDIMVLIANMQSTSLKIVNHVRFMIEEFEQQVSQKLKLFVLILHFSPHHFLQQSYPTLFLREWDHYYLDTIAVTSTKVDITNWLQHCCFDPSEIEEGDKSKNLSVVLKSMLHSLIPSLSARMTFGNMRGRQFNRSMKATEREEALKHVLDHYKLGNDLCTRFCEYWKPSVMMEYLEQTSSRHTRRDSVLNITDSIQAQFRAQFFYFCLYMLTQTNLDYNLDVLYTTDPSSALSSLFHDIFNSIPLPELDQLSLLCSNLASPQCSHRCNRFPFFAYVYDKLEKCIDLCSTCDHRTNESIQEWDSEHPLISDSNQILHKMAEKLFAVMETEVTLKKNML